jgi:RimJ/RimL family protein N-acetyltransferase
MAIHALISPSPPSPEPGTILLETERLLIRRYMLSDAPALAEIGNDPQVAIFMSDRFPNPYSVEDAETFIQNLNPQHDPTSPPEYPTTSAVLLKVAPADGHHHTPAGDGLVLIGSLGVRPRADVFYRSWEVGYFLGRDFWGKGYATEAVSAWARWMFETWPELLRIEGGRYSSNPRSGRVMEKSGFVFEGVKRSAVVKDGVVLDELVYGLLRSDVEKAST